MADAPTASSPIDRPASDSELLRAFVRDRRQPAFTELVSRHGSMVLGVCRRILRDEHEAEDVFQATFLILATKAHQIHQRHPASLAAWLHRVAYRIAVQKARSRQRKGTSEMEEVPSPHSEQWVHIARQEEQHLLHEELNRLPEIYREALVVCCLEGKSRIEAAELLGSTPEAVQKRFARGKQMLHMRLARRGVVASVALAAAALPSACEASLPALVSLTSDICTATVLHADKSIYATNVGRIAQTGGATMKIFTPTTLAALALVVCAPLLLLAGFAGQPGSSETAFALPIDLSAAQQHQSGPVTFVVQRGGDQDVLELSEKLRIILDRQKGDAIKLYIAGRGTWINGKTVSFAEAQAVIRASGLKKAILSVEPDVSQEKLAPWEKAVRDAGVDEVEHTTPPKADPQANLKKILDRQQGDQLKIYLKGTRGIYINGTQVSTGTLAEIIRQSGKSKAVLSAGLEVVPKRLEDMEQWLGENGIDEVQRSGTAAQDLTLQEVAEVSRQRAALAREEKLRAILAAQKGDQIMLYLNDRGAYINGKSISAKDIPAIVQASGLKQAIISAEAYLDKPKVTVWEQRLREAGVEEITLKSPDNN